MFFIYKDPENITDQDIKDYLLYLLEKQKCSHAYANQAVSSIKFLFRCILNKETNSKLPRPKKEKNYQIF
ncbi:phage integrase N-terminal SAM-like domain-containing protein [Dehalobacter restrictus]|uniref:phage integrase N-terminal SAM-like domain-containing protein n=1 Tax=Dehalobacter restrictus TaxID=55583 RepID=UPI0009FC0AA4|nr:phage integrase N-terminal SAM-like domain-containing protein [Dehalobacter restrictus]